MILKILSKKLFASPLFAIAIVFFILAAFSLIVTSPSLKTKPRQQTKNAVSTPTPQPKADRPLDEMPTNKQEVDETVAKVFKQTLPSSISQPTNTPFLQQNQPTNTQPAAISAPANTITINVKEPDGNFSFTVSYHDTSTPCSILNEAKSDGKIKSVTIQHYGPPLNSDYVKEINGFSDNWTFSINGEEKPSGCSNYLLGHGNTVTWKYN